MVLLLKGSSGYTTFMGSTAHQICRLCRNPAVLRESHIVPEFLHRPVYDKDHSAIFFDMEAERRAVRRHGLWEWLLCTDCEGRIGKWESYFADVWFARDLRPRLVPGDGELYRMSGLDYPRFTLFHLSILWRSGVSSLAPFSDVRLGPHEERLRRILLSGDPGPRDVYRLCAIALRDDNNSYKDDMLQLPRAGKYNGHHFYGVVFGGIHWLYTVSSHRNGWPVPSTFSQDGTLVYPSQHWTKSHAVLDAAAGIRRIGSNPRSGPIHR
jgi:hypothetical protein